MQAPRIRTIKRISMTDLVRAEASHEIIDTVGLLTVPITVEITPFDPYEVEICARMLAPGSDAFVAWLPKADWPALVQTAAQLHKVGMNPVPHIAARKLISQEDAQNLLASLRDEAGVTRALVIGGKTQAVSFIYPSSASLIETGLYHRPYAASRRRFSSRKPSSSNFFRLISSANSLR